MNHDRGEKKVDDEGNEDETRWGNKDMSEKGDEYAFRKNAGKSDARRHEGLK